MIPDKLIKEKIWLILAVLILVIAWSLPVLAQALYAESRPVFSLVFAIGWCGIVAELGLLLYGAARKSAQITGIVIVLALATFILLYRVPSRFIEPQFVAEDALIFFKQQRELGWSAFLLPYNGYYHTVVRVFAALCGPVPTLFKPAFYNLSWLGIYSLVFIYILCQYPDRKWAAVMALVTALISHTSEIFLVMTDLIWVAGLGLTAFLLFPVPAVKAWIRYVIVGVLFIFSLSGPFSLILMPFYFLRWIADRKNFPLTYVLTIALGATIQLSVLHFYYTDKHPGLPLTVSNLELCLQIAVLRIPWSLAVGYDPVEKYWLIGLAPILILFGFVGWEIKRDVRKHIFPLSCFLLSAIFLLMDLVRISPIDLLVPIVNGDRYFYIPKILFVWALIHLALKARNPNPFYVALFLCAMGSIIEFKSMQNSADLHWPHYAVLIDQGNPVVVPVNPPGWSAPLNGASPATGQLP